MSYTYQVGSQSSSPSAGDDFVFTQFSPVGANQGNGGTERVMVFIVLTMVRESCGELKLRGIHTRVLDGLGAVGSGAHALTENVSIPHMQERSKLLVEMVNEILK